MIQSVSITNPTGEVLTLELRSPEQSGFFVQSVEGLGPPKSNINVSESLYEDGAVYNSSRNQSRNLIFRLGFMDSPSESIEDVRLKSYRYFPNNKRLYFDVVTDKRRGVTSGFVESNEPNIFSKEESSTISVLCPDSYFYGAEILDTVFSGVVSNFQFPFENPSLTLPLITFGNIFINTQANLLYSGDVSTGVVFIINFLGAVNNLSIVNATNGQSMVFSSTKLIALTGSDFVAGDVLIVSTVKGSKYVTLSRGGVFYNVLNILSTISDWITVDKGDNVFTYTANTGLANMQFLIRHQLVYEGL